MSQNSKERKKKQFLAARRMILETESSSQLLKLLKKFGVEGDEHMLVTLSAVIHSITKYVNETEEMLGRRKHSWLLNDSTDFAQYISLIAKDSYLGKGSDIKLAKKLAADSTKLLKKIRNAKNGTEQKH